MRMPIQDEFRYFRHSNLWICMSSLAGAGTTSSEAVCILVSSKQPRGAATTFYPQLYSAPHTLSLSFLSSPPSQGRTLSPKLPARVTRGGGDLLPGSPSWPERRGYDITGLTWQVSRLVQRLSAQLAHEPERYARQISPSGYKAPLQDTR